MSFDFKTIVILISIINDICHNHLRPSSQQYLTIPNFIRSNNEQRRHLYKNYLQKSRASLLFALHQRCFRNQRENIINFILKQPFNICLFFMTQKLVSPVQVSLVLSTKRRKANPSWPKDIVLTRLWKIYLHSEEAAFVTQVIN